MMKIFWLLLVSAFMAYGKMTAYDSLISLAQNHQLDRAKQLAKKILEAEPQNENVLLVMSKLQTTGDSSYYYLTKSSFKGLKDRNGENLYLLGQYAYAKGNWRESNQQFEKLIKSHPQSMYILPSMYWWGNGLLELGDKKSLDSAEQVFLRLLQEQGLQDHYYSLALEGVAKSRLKRKLPAKAKDALMMALESSPQEQAPHLLLLTALTSKQIRDSVGYNYYRDKLIKQYPESMESLYIGQKFGTEKNSPLEKPWAKKNQPPSPPPSATGSTSTVQVPSTPAPPEVPILNNPAAEKTSSKPQGTPPTSTPEKILPFYLQFGAFSVLANAESRFSQLKQLPLKISIEQRNREGSTIHVLVSEGFATREEAQQFAEAQIKPKGIPFYILQKN